MREASSHRNSTRLTGFFRSAGRTRSAACQVSPLSRTRKPRVRHRMPPRVRALQPLHPRDSIALGTQRSASPSMPLPLQGSPMATTTLTPSMSCRPWRAGADQCECSTSGESGKGSAPLVPSAPWAARKERESAKVNYQRARHFSRPSRSSSGSNSVVQFNLHKVDERISPHFAPHHHSPQGLFTHPPASGKWYWKWKHDGLLARANVSDMSFNYGRWRSHSCRQLAVLL